MVKLPKSEVINGLRIERECVSRDCDRNCAECDIVQERDWLLLVYDNAIRMLEELCLD
jgi:hypothetical protein